MVSKGGSFVVMLVLTYLRNNTSFFLLLFCWDWRWRTVVVWDLTLDALYESYCTSRRREDSNVCCCLLLRNENAFLSNLCSTISLCCMLVLLSTNGLNTKSVFGLIWPGRDGYAWVRRVNMKSRRLLCWAFDDCLRLLSTPLLWSKKLMLRAWLQSEHFVVLTLT